MLKPALVVLALSSTFLAVRAEGAEPAAWAPPRPGSNQLIWLGEGLQVVEHLRRPGEVAASFKVEPKRVPEGHQVVFELISLQAAERVLRWRCVATQEIKECFAEPVLVAFLPKDERLRLEVLVTDPNGEATNTLPLAMAH